MPQGKHPSVFKDVLIMPKSFLTKKLNNYFAKLVF